VNEGPNQGLLFVKLSVNTARVSIDAFSWVSVVAMLGTSWSVVDSAVAVALASSWGHGRR
jgi:hypothetical protein